MELFVRNGRPGTLETEIYLVNFPGKGLGSVGSYYTIEPSGEVMGRPFTNDGSAEGMAKPFMICDERFWRDALEAIVVFANKKGIKSGDESFNQGKLEATEHHLEDMRSLVFNKNNINEK